MKSATQQGSNPQHISPKQQPIVSVVIPAYKAAQYIGAALDSVFAQTFTDFEVIVVNDGSPDTDELERVLAPYRNGIVYIKQDNLGPSGARNAAIFSAQGEYIAMLDSDDVWMPEYLTEQVKVLQNNPQLDLNYFDALLFGNSALAGRTFMETAPSKGPVTFESLLRYECSIITSCTIARRQALIDAGLFDENFIRCEDFDLWLRLAHRGGRLSYQTQVLAHHRVHGESLAADPVKMVESQIEVLKKVERILPLSSTQKRLIETQLINCEAQINLERGKRHFMAGQYESAAAALKQANGFYRSSKLRAVVFALRVAPRLLHLLYRLWSRNLIRRNVVAVN